MACFFSNSTIMLKDVLKRHCQKQISSVLHEYIMTCQYMVYVNICIYIYMYISISI